MRNEMVTLIDKLKNSEIPFEVTEHDSGTPQVWYPSIENPICDVVCFAYSYGGKEGLLEIMGLADEECIDDVQGYLTANDVFARIYTDYMNK